MVRLWSTAVLIPMPVRARSFSRSRLVVTFSLSRRLTAEALGTGFLVATVVGSGIMADRLSGGNEGLALLGNTVATGAILVVLILMFARISGAHFNPAVSLSFLLMRQITPGHTCLYVAAQVAGGVLGAVVAQLMFSEPAVQASMTVRTGWGQWLGEFVATFGLVSTILACVRFRPEAVAYAVGLFISAGYWFTSSTSFANPAVTIGRTLSDTFSGIRPADAPAFIAVQLIAAVAATAFFTWLLVSDAEESSASEGEAPD